MPLVTRGPDDPDPTKNRSDPFIKRRVKIWWQRENMRGMPAMQTIRQIGLGNTVQSRKTRDRRTK
jgi:hypothetical protein